MRIVPADLVPDPLMIDETFPVGVLEYALDVRQSSPLHVQGSAERIEEHRGPKDVVDDIRLRGRFAANFELLCARCLEPIKHHAEEHFDLIFRPAGTDAQQGERSISEAETEIGYYEDSGLVLEDAVREQVLLSLPDRSLCQPDCKGLCPSCGGNLNEVACSCGEAKVDPRWSALQNLAATVKAAE